MTFFNVTLFHTNVIPPSNVTDLFQNIDMDAQTAGQKSTLALMGNACSGSAFVLWCTLSTGPYTQLMVNIMAFSFVIPEAFKVIS